MKGAKLVRTSSWLPPLSPATIIGTALFCLYIGSAFLAALPIPFWASNNAGGLYTRAEEVAYCEAQRPEPSCSNSTRRTIYMQPYGGLGNRLRAVASALVLGQEADANVVIVWMDKEHGFRGGYYDLFESPKIPIGCFPGNALRESYARCKVHKVNHHSEWEHVKNKWQKMGDEEVMCLQSMMFLTEKQRGIISFFQQLKPVPSIMSAINALMAVKHWGDWGQWVGVHIRRTDLMLRCNTDDCHDGLKAEDVLPLSGYADILKKIHELAVLVDKPRFYLATDDPVTEQVIRQELQTAANLTEENGGCVSYSKAVRDASSNSLEMRNQVAGVREAVIDLVLLSKTQLLVGTVGSSFSQTPKLMGSPFFVSVGSQYENKV